jgi:hypothetical protein
MMKDKMEKHILKIDLIVILVSVFVLMGIVGYARPLIIAPFDEYESMDGEVLFEFARADILLIDDNEDFTTPDEYRIVDGERVELEPGIYYWRVSGVLGSEVRKLTINSRVELELVERGEGMAVVNAGNVRLNVDVYDGEELIEKKKLDVGEVSGEGTKFVGAQDE